MMITLIDNALKYVDKIIPYVRVILQVLITVFNAIGGPLAKAGSWFVDLFPPENSKYASFYFSIGGTEIEITFWGLAFLLGFIIIGIIMGLKTEVGSGASREDTDIKQSTTDADFFKNTYMDKRSKKEKKKDEILEKLPYAPGSPLAELEKEKEEKKQKEKEEKKEKENKEKEEKKQKEKEKEEKKEKEKEEKDDKKDKDSSKKD